MQCSEAQARTHKSTGETNAKAFKMNLVSLNN